jgi:hypothetical protein
MPEREAVAVAGAGADMVTHHAHTCVRVRVHARQEGGREGGGGYDHPAYNTYLIQMLGVADE